MLLEQGVSKFNTSKQGVREGKAVWMTHDGKGMNWDALGKAVHVLALSL